MRQHRTILITAAQQKVESDLSYGAIFN